jgi:hypothetical protein
MNLEYEISHLHKAVELLKKYEGKSWEEVIPCGDFPEPIRLHENIGYVRNILENTVQYTSKKEEYVKVKCLPENAEFFTFQETVNPSTQMVPSHCVIQGFIRRHGSDYRFQVAPSPVPELRNRRQDNTSVGRKANAAASTNFECNE